jgi:hypothetical protein
MEGLRLKVRKGWAQLLSYPYPRIMTKILNYFSLTHRSFGKTVSKSKITGLKKQEIVDLETKLSDS